MALEPGTHDPSALLRQLTQTWTRMLGASPGLMSSDSGVPLEAGFGQVGKASPLSLGSLALGQEFLGTLRPRVGGLQLDWRGGAPLGVESSPELPVGRPLVFRVRQLDPRPVLQFVKEGPATSEAVPRDPSGTTQTVLETTGRPVTIVDVRTGLRSRVVPRSAPQTAEKPGIDPGPTVRLTLSDRALQQLDPHLVEGFVGEADQSSDVDRQELHQARVEPAGQDRFHSIPVGPAQVIDHARGAEYSQLEREAGLGRKRMRGMRRIDLDLSALGPVRLEFGTLGGRLRVRLGAARERTISMLRSEGGRLRDELASLDSVFELDVFRFEERASARARRSDGLDLML